MSAWRGPRRYSCVEQVGRREKKKNNQTEAKTVDQRSASEQSRMVVARSSDESRQGSRHVSAAILRCQSIAHPMLCKLPRGWGMGWAG